MQPPQWGPPPQQQPPAQVPYPAPLAPNEVICPSPNCGWRGLGHVRVVNGAYGMYCARCGVYVRPGSAPNTSGGCLVLIGIALGLLTLFAILDALGLGR